jgi:hypothetical protein
LSIRVRGLISLALLLLSGGLLQAQDITTGRLIHYGMEEGTGTTVADDAAASGTQSCTLSSAGWAAGRIGTWATTYNGAQYCEAASTAAGVNGGTALTWAVWVKPAFQTSGATRRLFVRGMGFNDYYTFGLSLSTSGAPFCGLTRDLGANAAWTADAAISAGVWTHLACAWNRTTGTSTDMVLYVNGVPVTTTMGGSGYDNTFTLEDVAANGRITLGALNSNGLSGYFTGDLDEAYLFNRQLTQADIQALPGVGPAAAPRRVPLMFSQRPEE